MENMSLSISVAPAANASDRSTNHLRLSSQRQALLGANGEEDTTRGSKEQKFGALKAESKRKSMLTSFKDSLLRQVKANRRKRDITPQQFDLLYRRKIRAQLEDKKKMYFHEINMIL